MLIIVLYAQGTIQKSYGPILNLPILTDTDSNRFLKILTLPIPIPIFIKKYHTDTDFLKNTNIPIPIPIIPNIGPSLDKRDYRSTQYLNFKKLTSELSLVFILS